MKRFALLFAACGMLLILAPCASARSYGPDDQAQEIALIQEALEELDFYYADITGKYGKRTQAAVKKFQKCYGLEQSGIADEETQRMIFAKAGIEAPQSSDEQTDVYGSETLREGSRGDAVRLLQENLTLLEFYSGSITGSYGRLTKEAVRRFQKEHDLSADGVAGPRTVKKLTQLLVGEDAQETPVTLLPNTVQNSTFVSLEDVELLNTEWTLRRTSSSGYVRRLQKRLLPWVTIRAARMDASEKRRKTRQDSIRQFVA